MLVNFSRLENGIKNNCNYLSFREAQISLILQHAKMETTSTIKIVLIYMSVSVEETSKSDNGSMLMELDVSISALIKICWETGKTSKDTGVMKQTGQMEFFLKREKM